jgi:hypothetical protein
MAMVSKHKRIPTAKLAHRNMMEPWIIVVTLTDSMISFLLFSFFFFLSVVSVLSRRDILSGASTFSVFWEGTKNFFHILPRNRFIFFISLRMYSGCVCVCVCVCTRLDFSGRSHHHPYSFMHCSESSDGF